MVDDARREDHAAGHRVGAEAARSTARESRSNKTCRGGEKGVNECEIIGTDGGWKVAAQPPNEAHAAGGEDRAARPGPIQ
jgi:hypothetical protein